MRPDTAGQSRRINLCYQFLIRQNCYGFDFYFQVRRSQGRYLYLSAGGERPLENTSGVPRRFMF